PSPRRRLHVVRVIPCASAGSSATSFFFFFQAEDGIRDRNVTGVQTCALPISKLTNFCLLYKTFRLTRTSFQTEWLENTNSGGLRSEERRVGKECRSRGGREYYTENVDGDKHAGTRRLDEGRASRDSDAARQCG